MSKKTPTTKPAAPKARNAKGKAIALATETATALEPTPPILRPGHVIYDSWQGAPGIIVKISADGRPIILNAYGDLYTQGEIEDPDWVPAPGSPLDLAAGAIMEAVAGFLPMSMTADPFYRAKAKLLALMADMLALAADPAFDEKTSKRIAAIADALQEQEMPLSELSMDHTMQAAMAKAAA